MQGEGWRGWASLTRVLQINNQIGDDGARGLGEGLKLNSSLKELNLVGYFVFLIDLFVVGCDARKGMGGGGLHLRVCCRAITQLGTTVLEG
jgi:hypothetical protein